MLWIDALKGELLSVKPRSADSTIERLEPGWLEELSIDWKNERDIPKPLPAFAWKEEGDLHFHFIQPTIHLQVTDLRAPNANGLHQKAVDYRKYFEGGKAFLATETSTQTIPFPIELFYTYTATPLEGGLVAFAGLQSETTPPWASIPTEQGTFQFEAFVYIKDQSIWILDIAEVAEPRADDEELGVDKASELVATSLALQHHMYYSPYFAVIDGAVFILRFGAEPAIFRFSPGTNKLVKLAHVPTQYIRPVWQSRPELTSAQNEMARFLALESYNLAAGIFAIDDHLYMLGRRNEHSGKASWWLLEIDQGTGVTVRSLRLPIRPDALHATLIPGSNRVAVIEKGPVQPINGLPYQAPLSLITFPTDWLEDTFLTPLSTSTSNSLCW